MKKFFLALADRIEEMILKILSLKFFFTMLHELMGIGMFIYLVKIQTTSAPLWGVWASHMSLGLAIYTTANVKIKGISGIVETARKVVQTTKGM